MNLEPTQVWQDFHRRTYLHVGEAGRTLYLVPMRASGLNVKRFSPKKQRTLGLHEISYPMPRALQLFREAARDYGASASVRKALRVRERKAPQLKALEVRL